MKAAIIYNKFFDLNGEEQLIGGIETYLLNLARLCHDMNMDTTIFQWSNIPFKKELDGFRVIGMPVCEVPLKRRRQACFDFAASEIDERKDLLVFGADHVSVPSQNPRHVSIQHGIGWDLPVRYISSREILKYEWAAKLKQYRTVSSSKRYFENCYNTVCVDYNFLNWYRTTITREPENHRIWVIPNFAVPASSEQLKQRDYSNKTLRILFARRFVKMRGTGLMVEVAKYLLEKFSDIRFTFAGEGPDEDWMRAQFSNENRVEFTKYKPDEVRQIHLAHDIAVVPSMGSEGTSLSVAEAMAVGCPVVATAIGGITNMIINNYNGLLVMPNPKALRDAISRLIEDSSLRRRLGSSGFQTASVAFSLDQWKRSWKDVLMEITHDE